MVDTIGIFIIKYIGHFSFIEENCLDDEDASFKVEILVREKNRIDASAMVNMENNQTSSNLSMLFPNVSGRCDGVHVQYERQLLETSGSQYLIGYSSIPNPSRVNHRVTVFGHKTIADMKPNDFNYSQNGIGAKYSIYELRNNFELDYTFDVVVDRIIRQSTELQKFKRITNGIRFRSNNLLDEDHIRLNCNWEISTFDLTQPFLKTDFKFWSKPVKFPYSDITFNISAQAGAIVNLSPQAISPPLYYRYFLGGPHNIRGYDLRTCGGKLSGSEFEGGTRYCAIGGTLVHPLPFSKGKQMHFNLAVSY
ncbi:hypothetical protein ACOME3_003438 [Neoechinorhynchus agilis]